MKEQKKLPRFHRKLTNREDFVRLMKGEYLSLDDNHLRIAIWYDLFDFNNSEYRDSVRELLETKEVFLVCKKTRDFCTTYTMYKKFFKIRRDDKNLMGYAVYDLKGKRLNYKKSLYVSPLIAEKRTIDDIKETFAKGR
jgi:hypothetical protein